MTQLNAPIQLDAQPLVKIAGDHSSCFVTSARISRVLTSYRGKLKLSERDPYSYEEGTALARGHKTEG